MSENYGVTNYGINRYGMSINYVPITIGVDDGTPYEEIYPTVGDFVTAWTGNTVNNSVLYFSDVNDYVEDDDPSLNPINQDPVYWVQTKTLSDIPVYNYRPSTMKLSLAMEL
jgi:hypothetical protein